jgi:hypothetical protein
MNWYKIAQYQHVAFIDINGKFIPSNGGSHLRSLMNYYYIEYSEPEAEEIVNKYSLIRVFIEYDNVVGFDILNPLSQAQKTSMSNIIKSLNEQNNIDIYINFVDINDNLISSKNFKNIDKALMYLSVI